MRAHTYTQPIVGHNRLDSESGGTDNKLVDQANAAAKYHYLLVLGLELSEFVTYSVCCLNSQRARWTGVDQARWARCGRALNASAKQSTNRADAREVSTRKNM